MILNQMLLPHSGAILATLELTGKGKRAAIASTRYKSTIMSRVEGRPPGEYDESGDILTSRKVKSRFGSHTCSAR